MKSRTRRRSSHVSRYSIFFSMLYGVPLLAAVSIQPDRRTWDVTRGGPRAAVFHHRPCSLCADLQPPNGQRNEECRGRASIARLFDALDFFSPLPRPYDGPVPRQTEESLFSASCPSFSRTTPSSRQSTIASCWCTITSGSICLSPLHTPFCSRWFLPRAKAACTRLHPRGPGGKESEAPSSSPWHWYWKEFSRSGLTSPWVSRRCFLRLRLMRC